MPKNPRADETILQPASGTGSSLRITVPAFIINQFNLKKGDRFRWKIEGESIGVETIQED
jgi:hypothetical protein